MLKIHNANKKIHSKSELYNKKFKNCIKNKKSKNTNYFDYKLFCYTKKSIKCRKPKSDGKIAPNVMIKDFKLYRNNNLINRLCKHFLNVILNQTKIENICIILLFLSHKSKQESLHSTDKYCQGKVYFSQNICFLSFLYSFHSLINKISK